MALGDTPKKLTLNAKAAIQLVFEDLGGTCRLLEWANQPGNLGVFYTQIWSKIIPKDVKAEVDGQILIEVQSFQTPEQLTGQEQPVLETLSSGIHSAIASAADDAEYEDLT